MSVIILNIFEINYSQLIQYEILEKLVTLIFAWILLLFCILTMSLLYLIHYWSKGVIAFDFDNMILYSKIIKRTQHFY